MTVLSVAYPFAPVSLDAAGGSEQILALLDRGLVAEGHRSIVIGADGSRVRGALLGLQGTDRCGDATARERVYEHVEATLGEVLRTCAVDLVHLHGLDFLRYLPADGTPVLATLHLPRSFYSEQVFRLKRPHTWLNCVSRSQRGSCPPCALLADEIENGVPLELLETSGHLTGDYVLVMGRICPEKGFHLAVDAAERAGVPLYLAGKLFPYPEHERYWREVLQPRFHAPHRYLGTVAMHEKSRLLAEARCLLAPSLVPETSSLVAMEAAACGTPVIAFRSGALEEVVEHGKTGFLVSDVEEMAARIIATGGLDRAECRSVAQKRFSASRMVHEYLALYRRILAAGQ